MATKQVQTTAAEEEVRKAIEQAVAAQGGVTKENTPGRLVMDVGGSVGTAYLAGGFRNKMKMPQELVVTTSSGPGGTGVTMDVHSRGTGSGIMSGGVLGAVKQGKAETAWLEMAMEAIPQKTTSESS